MASPENVDRVTNPMSPEDHLRARIESQRQEIEQLRADISQAYYLRDKAEGRYCTALGAIEQLHAAVKTAQELAATRLMEIGRLSKREKNLMDVIDSRDRALGFVPLDEVHASEPGACASRESDWCCTHCGRDNDPSETHCVHCEWSRKHTVAGVLHERGCEDNPCRCGALKSQGASRDASSEPLQGASFPMSNERSHELAEWLRNNWAGHSMMMEIASMLQKDRGCPMANKYTFRSLGMLGQMYDPIGMEVNFPNDTEFYLASDIASSAQRT